ncbi:MAG: DUF4386 domain-containing protein [Crocinitomicaceae bacterium]
MKKLALTGGIAYVIIFITGIFANFNVMETMRDLNSILNTYNNLKEGQDLLLMGIISFVVMLIADFVVTLVLCKLFHETDSKLNMRSSTFRMINVIFFGIALYFLYDVYSLLQVSSEPANEMRMALAVDNALNTFDTIWLIGLIFFGIHLVLLSKVLDKAKNIHRSISALLFIAGVGYVVDSCLHLFYWDYASISHISTIIVVLPGLIGELSLTFRILLKGIRKQPAVC